MPSQVQIVKMDSVDKLTEDLENTTLEERKSEELRRNQNIFTEEKKTVSQVKVIKARNDAPRSPAPCPSIDVSKHAEEAVKSEDVPTDKVGSSEAPIFRELNLERAFEDLSIRSIDVRKHAEDAEKSKDEPTDKVGSSEPPVFKESRLEREFENLSIRSKVPKAGKLTEIRTLGPPGIAVPSQGRDDDEYNPAKYSRPNRSPEGPVDDLHTPSVSDQPIYPLFPARAPELEYPARAPELEYPARAPELEHPARQASPTDSGYAPSPPGLELPREVDELLDQFFDGQLGEMDAFNSLRQMNISEDCRAKVDNKIAAFIARLTKKTSEPELPELDLPEKVGGGKDFDYINFPNIITLEQPDSCSSPAYQPTSLPDVPVPVTVTEMFPNNNTPTYESSQKRPFQSDSNFSTADTRQALQQHIKDKMRTEPGCFGGYGGYGGSRRQMSDISNFVQNLSEEDRQIYEECRGIIQKYSDAEVTKVNKQGDTLLHLYMIYSPEKEHPDFPPRRKMKLLLYCLLVRQMEKSTGAEGLINRKNDKGQTPLYLAACVVNFPLAVSMFLHFGADPNLRRATKDLEGPAPIHKVVERGDDCAETLAHLLNDEKCDPNLLSNDGLTPLMIACRSHQSSYRNPDTGEVAIVSTLKCVQMLLNHHRVDAFAKSASSGRAAIHYAVEKGNMDLIKVWKPFASRPNHDDVTISSTREPQKLVNVTDRDGNNVLHILAGLQSLSTENQVAVANLLLEMGADVTRRNGERRIPRDLARSMKNNDLATIFIMPKSRKPSNPSRTKSSRSSDDTSPRSQLEYNQSMAFNYSPVSVFPTSPSDSGQRYSPPNTSPTHPGQAADLSGVYQPNGGPFVFGAQNAGYAMSGGQSTIQFGAPLGGGSPMGAGQYSPPGGLSPQGAGRTSPPRGHSPLGAGQFVTGANTQGLQQGGISPQRVGQFSPQHSPQGVNQFHHHSPQSTGQCSPPGGHSPQGVGQYSPGHSSQGAGQYSPGHSSQGVGQYSPGHSSQGAGQYSPGHSPQGAGQYSQSLNYVQNTTQYNQGAAQQMNVFTSTGQFLPTPAQAPAAYRHTAHMTQYDVPLMTPATRQNPGEVYARDGDANPFGDVLTGNKL